MTEERKWKEGMVDCSPGTCWTGIYSLEFSVRLLGFLSFLSLNSCFTSFEFSRLRILYSDTNSNNEHYTNASQTPFNFFNILNI